MDILILGNGFDLAHNLKTSYKDFLEYCSKLNIQDITDGAPDYKKNCKNNLWMKHFITKQKELGDTWIDLETEIYNVIKNINSTDAMSNSGFVDNLLPKVITVSKNNMQFDFYNISDFLMRPNHEPDVGEKEYTNNVYTDVSEKLYTYIKTSKGYVNFLYDQLRDFTKIFEGYLIENINLKSSPYLLSLSPNTANKPINLKVISFNYTNICEAFYHRKSSNDCEYNIKTIYIHGKANTDDCTLVLGTHSFDRINDEKDRALSMKLNVFQKHNQRHKYGTIEAYQDFLKEITNPKKIINPIFHVIGHSLDKTDHKVLKHIFTANKNSLINIYYHDEATQEKLINNITNIIGEDEVMTKVRLIHQHNEKRSALIPINK